MSSSDSQFGGDAQIFSGLSCFTALSCCSLCLVSLGAVWLCCRGSFTPLVCSFLLVASDQSETLRSYSLLISFFLHKRSRPFCVTAERFVPVLQVAPLAAERHGRRDRELLRRRSGLRRSIGIVYVGLPSRALAAADAFEVVVQQIVLIVETAGLYTPK